MSFGSILRAMKAHAASLEVEVEGELTSQHVSLQMLGMEICLGAVWAREFSFFVLWWNSHLAIRRGTACSTGQYASSSLLTNDMCRLRLTLAIARSRHPS